MTTAPAPQKNNTITIIAIILGGIFALCLVCLVLGMIGNILNPQTASTTVPPTEISMDAILTSAVKTVTVEQTQSAAQAATQEPAQAPTETPQPAASPNFGKVGDRIEQGGIALTVVNVLKVASVSEFLQPEPGNTYLVVEVIIENISRDDETPYNPLYFSVKDADGFQYNVTMLAPDPALSSGKLVKGDKVRGNVAFEVKETASGLVISYEPLVLLGGYETIRIELGQ